MAVSDFFPHTSNICAPFGVKHRGLYLIPFFFLEIKFLNVYSFIQKAVPIDYWFRIPKPFGDSSVSIVTVTGWAM
jgi:hypothetical protein